MSALDLTIRPAVADDLDSIAEIYAHHVLIGVATFELAPPDRGEWRRRFEAVALCGLPFVTATLDSEVAGYGYSGPWKTRPARHAALLLRQRRCSSGHRFDRGSRRRGFSCAAPQSWIHRRWRLTAVGFKHGRWFDTVLLQRHLAEVTD